MGAALCRPCSSRVGSNHERDTDSPAHHQSLALQTPMVGTCPEPSETTPPLRHPRCLSSMWRTLSNSNSSYAYENGNGFLKKNYLTSLLSTVQSMTIKPAFQTLLITQKNSHKRCMSLNRTGGQLQSGFFNRPDVPLGVI